MSGNLDLQHGATVTAAPSAEEILKDSDNFSVDLGGPLFQLLCRAHMANDTLALIRQRIAVIALLAWLPLAALAALEGHLLDHTIAVPFLYDFEVHIRLLVAVPLLIIAELVVHRRLRPIARAFIDRKIIPEASSARFDEAIRSASRLRNSVLAEVLMLAFVYGVGVLVIWRHYTALQASTWYATASPDGLKLSLAGMWYGYVSLPIFQFLLLRWYFRLFVWTRFLWQVSRINLSLVPTHPDRVGGLGFLANTVYAFTVLLVAHGAMLAAQFANRILFTGAALTEFKVDTGAMILFLLCIVSSDRCWFLPPSSRVRNARGLANTAPWPSAMCANSISNGYEMEDRRTNRRSAALIFSRLLTLRTALTSSKPCELRQSRRTQSYGSQLPSLCRSSR
jgi:hypothetical protein